jgi:hypothetical protein
MADREQTQSSKRDMAGTTTSGSKGEERQHGVKSPRSVGRDVADQSKEKNTEIAVEAGRRRPGEQRTDKR